MLMPRRARQSTIHNPQSAIRNCLLLVVVAVVSCALFLASGDAATAREQRGLDFYFIDTEGGAATLIVTPAGESILKALRESHWVIGGAAAREAGLSQIDHYITTHWHSDHVGGAWPLSKLIPIRQAYGHRVPDPLPEDISADLITAWRGVTADPVFLSAGDSVKLRGTGPVSQTPGATRDQ